MRHILRTQKGLLQMLRSRRYGFSTTTAEVKVGEEPFLGEELEVDELVEEEAEAIEQVLEEKKTFRKGKQYPEDVRSEMEMLIATEKEELDAFKKTYEKGNTPYRIENEWTYSAPQLFHPDYELENSPKGQKILQKKLYLYEQNMKLNINHDLTPKLFQQSKLYNKMAKYHISQMDPLVASFIKQGYNFLDKALLLYLIDNKKINILKQLMTLEAFEGVYIIDEEVIITIIQEVEKDHRSRFLLNLLPFEAGLLLGTKPRYMKHSVIQEIKFTLSEPDFTRFLYEAHGSKEVNKLRLLWSYQRYYLHEYSFFEYMTAELKKLQFEVDDPQLQKAITKEIDFLISTAFEEESLGSFFFEIVGLTKTYNNFIKMWTLILILVSKLKAIPRVVNESTEFQLHQIFHMIKVNLPQQMGDELLESRMFQLLINEENNKIWLQNYRRCLVRYQNTVIKPQSTTYHSPLSRFLQNKQPSITVFYQQQQDVKPYARTVITLKKDWEDLQKKNPKSQKEMISDLMRGDYQSVFDHFLMRYSLSSDFDLAARFQIELKKADKELKFNNQQEEALYKLKLANNFFLAESHGKSLKRVFLTKTKCNLGVISTLEDGDLSKVDFWIENKDRQEYLMDDSKISKYLQYRFQQSKLEQQQREQQSEDDLKLGLAEQEDDLEADKEEKAIDEDEEVDEDDNGDLSEKEIEELIEEEFGSEEVVQNQYLAKLDLTQNTEKLLMEVMGDLEKTNIIDKKSFEELEQLPMAQAQRKMRQIFMQYREHIMHSIDNLCKDPNEEKDVFEMLKAQILKRQNKTSLNEVSEESISTEVQEMLNIVSLFNEGDELILGEEMLRREKRLKRSGRTNPDQMPLFPTLSRQEQILREKDSELIDQYVNDFLEIPSYKEIKESFPKNEKYLVETSIDGAREDRSIIHSFQVSSVINSVKIKKSEQGEEGEVEDDEEPSVSRTKAEKDFQKELTKEFSIIEGLPEVSYAEVMVLNQIKQEILAAASFKPEKDMQMFDEFQQDKPQNTRQQQNFNKKPVGFLQKNKYQFSTSTHVEQVATEVTPEQQFDLDKMEDYRTKDVDRGFYELMKNENHIPSVGSGIEVAKYLFLHSKKEGPAVVLNSNKKMSIEFTSVVGTRTKSYAKYISNTLFNYELDDMFYEKLLENQQTNYNRHDFKQIVAHMIYFKNSLTNEMVQLICKICESHQIGYTFVEIVQFIKFNDIKISDDALEMITLTWHRFRLINEDMLTFVREYCRKMNVPFKTSYYSHFCSSLIKIKDFDKLRDLCSSVLTEIKPKTFKVDNNMRASDVPALQKVWKVQQQKEYIKMYLQLIETVVTKLDKKIPDFMLELFTEYRKLVPELGEKELGFGLVCCCLNKSKFEEQLLYLEKNPKFGTEFMYDCLMQSLLSNFEELQQYSERMFDATVFINRLVLNDERIQRAMIVFKKSSTSNSFSKFLEHCLRFQPSVTTNNDIKKEMFFILNNNVEDVSVGGVFNLLDFIFNDKRGQEREEYRAIKLSEEEKEKRLAEIQSATSEQTIKKNSSKDTGQQSEQKLKPADGKKMTKEQALAHKEKLSKKDVKQIKKEKLKANEKINLLMPQIMTENKDRQQSEQVDMEIIGLIRGQTKKHASAKRKGALAFGHLFEGSIELMKADEDASKEAQKKVGGAVAPVKGTKGAKGAKGKK